MNAINTRLQIMYKAEKYKIIERQTMNMLRIIGEDLKKQVEEHKAAISQPKLQRQPTKNELKMIAKEEKERKKKEQAELKRIQNEMKAQLKKQKAEEKAKKKEEDKKKKEDKKAAEKAKKEGIKSMNTFKPGSAEIKSGPSGVNGLC